MLQEGIDEYITSLSMNEQGRGETNQNTIVAYRNDLNQACAYLKRGHVENWQQVTRADIANYLLEMRDAQSYRPTTIARKLASLKTFFRYLRSVGSITVDPIEELSAPRIQKDLPQVLNQEQVASLFRQVAVDAPAGMRDMAMLHMLYATGMRVSELVALNLEHVDIAHATVVCAGRNGKNKRERVLPLSPLALEQTKRYLQSARQRLILHHPDEQALFVNHHGERLTRQGFWLIIKGYARQANITGITPHMLRHSFAILMLQNGMELRSVQELLGHAHIATTQVYSQLARESVKSTV
ncbi:MAG TPA: tyrosine-type recombinase/integrase [Ktedonobacteraceae bacterium]|nr:tyrosine-type recombinase/integrase [Ktedonobacteraceae bacterium]